MFFDSAAHHKLAATGRLARSGSGGDGWAPPCGVPLVPFGGEITAGSATDPLASEFPVRGGVLYRAMLQARPFANCWKELEGVMVGIA